MSFVKHTWVKGELVTPALLNRIENAIEELYDGEAGGTVEEATDAEIDALFDNFLEDD